MTDSLALKPFTVASVTLEPATVIAGGSVKISIVIKDNTHSQYATYTHSQLSAYTHEEMSGMYSWDDWDSFTWGEVSNLIWGA